MANYSETEEEARRRATRAMLDNVYKQTADSRGQMMRASRRAFTDSPERGMSPDGEAAAADARAMAGDLVRGSSDDARARLGVAPSAPVAKSAPVALAVKAAPGGSSGKSGKGADMSRRARVMRGRQASADAEYKRRAVERPAERGWVQGPPMDDDGIEYMIPRRPLDREAVNDDLAERRDAGLLSDEAYRRALESMLNNRSREDIAEDLNERRAAGLLDEAEYRRIRESMAR